jgi:DGQHR domain-containing protein
MKSNIQLKGKIINQYINQEHNAKIFSTIIKFEDLYDVYKFNLRENDKSNPEESGIKRENNDFQRESKSNRIKEMSKYLITKEDSENEINKIPSPKIFPTSLLLWSELNFSELKEDDSIYLENNETIFIPREKESMLIVDGQHRFKALKEIFENTSDETIKENCKLFEFPVSIILDCDIYIASLIFADVNFKQKPVNKSLYYDIFGSVDGDWSELRFLHLICRSLNNNKDSPLYNMINLIGTGTGTISQSFFIRLIERHVLSSKGIWREKYLDFALEKNSSKFQSEVLSFLEIYFESISNIYNKHWIKREINDEVNKSKYKYILCKTTGIGAFLRLIPEFYYIYQDFEEYGIREILELMSEEEENNLFGESSVYAGSGSDGSQSKLAKELKKIFNFE